MPRTARTTTTRAAPPRRLAALPTPSERQATKLPSPPKRLTLPKPTRVSDDRLLLLALLALAAFVLQLWLMSRATL